MITPPVAPQKLQLLHMAKDTCAAYIEAPHCPVPCRAPESAGRPNNESIAGSAVRGASTSESPAKVSLQSLSS